MKKILSVLLSIAVFISVCPAAWADETKDTKKIKLPYTSEEVLYGVLDHSGKVKDIYSVIILNSSKNYKAEYYGPFSDVKNLSDTRELKLKNDRISFSTPKGRFYFQSSLKETGLPWNVDIGYTLDDKPINPDSLGGQRGKLGIDISVKNGKIDDSSFFNSYIMQLTVTLDSQLCRNIQAEDATVANSGANKLVTFTVLPGTESELKLSADVVNFSMQGITLSCVPYTMGDSLGNLSDMAAGLQQLTDAVSKLSDGASQLYGGASQLQNGAAQFGDGLYKLSANSASLVAGSEMFLNMFNTFRDALIAASNLPDTGEVKDLSSLIAAIDELCCQLDSSASQMEQSAVNLEAARANINSAFESVPDSVSSDSEFVLEAAYVPEVVEALTSAYGDSGYAQFIVSLNNIIAAANAAITAKQVWNQVAQDYDNAVQTLHGLSAYLKTTSESIKNLREIIAGMSGTTAGEQLDELIKKASELSNGYAKFHEGLVAYTNGVDQLAANWGSLYDGIVRLVGGTAQLSDGTSQLNAGTQGIPGKIDSMLSAFTGKDFKAHSFLSEKNTTAKAVQFVLTTQAIELNGSNTSADDSGSEKTPFEIFWGRLTALFK